MIAVSGGCYIGPVAVSGPSAASARTGLLLALVVTFGRLRLRALTPPASPVATFDAVPQAAAFTSVTVPSLGPTSDGEPAATSPRSGGRPDTSRPRVLGAAAR